jgi:hypothetical protein
MLRPTVSRPVYLGVKHPTGAQDQICITVRQLRICFRGAPFLTTGRVCHLQFLLAFASAVILGSEFRGTHDHILLSQIWDSPNLEGLVPVFITPTKRVSQLYLRLLRLTGYGGGIRTRLHGGTTITELLVLVMWPRHGRRRKCLFYYCVFSRLRGNVSTVLFPSNGCCTVAYLQSCYLAISLHVTVLSFLTTLLKYESNIQ